MPHVQPGRHEAAVEALDRYLAWLPERRDRHPIIMPPAPAADEVSGSRRIRMAPSPVSRYAPALELAQRIYGGYRGEGTPAVLSLMFEPSELRPEPKQFLRAHFKLEADARAGSKRRGTGWASCC